jgi:hypothetical protein
MSVKELDSLMTLIAEKKRQMEQQESETNMQILLVFLHCLRKQSWKSWMRFVVTPNNTIEVLIFWFLYHANQTLYYRIFIHLAIYIENCYLFFVLRFLREVYSC